MRAKTISIMNASTKNQAASASVSPPNRLWTIPNALCVVRLAASPGLVLLAIADEPRWTLALFLTLMATDWLDGKLAVWLDQRSRIGPRLDSIADVAMYAALLFAGAWLQGSVLVSNWIWVGAALVTYVVSCVAALLKFWRLPSYHTRTAKAAWLLMIVAVVALFADWSVWPLRIAMLGVVIANLEAVTITALLPRWRADVISLVVAFQLRRSELTTQGGTDTAEIRDQH